MELSMPTKYREKIGARSRVGALIVVLSLSFSPVWAGGPIDNLPDPRPKKATVKKMDLSKYLTDEDKLLIALTPICLLTSIALPQTAPVIYEKYLEHITVHVMKKDIEAIREMVAEPAAAPAHGWSGGPSPSFSGAPAPSSMPGVTTK
jgi:hypothetical protein